MIEKKIKEWFEQNMQTHTDWTGTKIETKDHWSDMDKLINSLLEHIKEDKDEKFYW